MKILKKKILLHVEALLFFQGLVSQLRGEVMEANNRLQRTVSSEKPFLIIFTVHCFDDFNFEDESSSTANTQEQLLELGARIDHVSEKMYPILSMVVGMKMNGFKIFNEQVIPVTPARYDFEANKKNNLIFYGLPSDQRETPNALVTKVKHKNMRDYQPLLKELI